MRFIPLLTSPRIFITVMNVQAALRKCLDECTNHTYIKRGLRPNGLPPLNPPPPSGIPFDAETLVL